jgi:hypothetical protein
MKLQKLQSILQTLSVIFNVLLQLLRRSFAQQCLDDEFGGTELQGDAEFLPDLQSPCSTGLFTNAVPRHLSGLFFSPVIETNDENADPADSSQAKVVSRGLFRPPSAPVVVGQQASKRFIRRRNSQKRLESERDAPADGVTVETKRHRAAMDVCDSAVTTAALSSRRLYMRCHSETEITIKSALHRADLYPDLIGDFTKSYCLPLVINSKHPDLKAISADTVCGIFCLVNLFCFPAL